VLDGNRQRTHCRENIKIEKDHIRLSLKENRNGKEWNREKEKTSQE